MLSTAKSANIGFS